ncbi:hypothetical protein RHSIM_Rhsim08G0182600 [Rhododendron simsii]|uniref:Uncharacterized protein n=1 Tax=Rhododendron simsii TaxID=118357 RepID=A0A834LG12_RHOSS|nr:hypothetical protein RHSIM_Rhsim08G0182600 [Rhododendron simsii]
MAQIGRRQEFQQIFEDEFDTALQIDSVLVLFICPMPSITATASATDDDVNDIRSFRIYVLHHVKPTVIVDEVHRRVVLARP